ncbi:hypothetical protein [Arthrobacter sp. MMS18-M83]|nr:hypothetical protein [Arthrobacter sp. MMS18-M83]WAH97758.1 hypothetical protein OW521_02325 [Arthrobacter sp. MMS18-M83]
MQLTSVSRDASAVPVEYILGEAIKAVPELALHAITRSVREKMTSNHG